MECGLRFASSSGVHTNDIDACIRQILIDIEGDTPSIKEMKSVFKSVLERLCEPDVDPDQSYNLGRIIDRMLQKEETLLKDLIEFFQKAPGNYVLLVVVIKHMTKKYMSQELADLFKDCYQKLLPQVLDGSDPIVYDYPHPRKLKTFFRLLGFLDTDIPKEDVEALLARMKQEDTVFDATFLIRAAAKYHLLNMLPRNILVDFPKLDLSVEEATAMLEEVDGSNIFLESEVLNGIKWIKNQNSSRLATVFLKRSVQLKPSIPSNMIAELLTIIEPSDCTPEMWEYFRSIRVVLPAEFSSKITDWSIPHLIFLTRIPEGTIPVEKLQEMYQTLPATGNDYLQLMTLDRNSPGFKTTNFWISFLEKIGEMSVGVQTEMALLFVDSMEENIVDSFVDIVLRFDYEQRICQWLHIVKEANGGEAFSGPENPRIAELILERESFSSCFWDIIPYSPSYIYTLALDPRFEAKKYELLEAVCYLCFSNGRAFPDIRELEILDQTEDSINEVIAYLKHMCHPNHFGRYVVGFKASNVAHSLIACAYVLGYDTVSRRPRTEIQNLEKYIAPVVMIVLNSVDCGYANPMIRHDSVFRSLLRKVVIRYPMDPLTEEVVKAFLTFLKARTGGNGLRTYIIEPDMFYILQQLWQPEVGTNGSSYVFDLISVFGAVLNRGRDAPDYVLFRRETKHILRFLYENSSDEIVCSLKMMKINLDGLDRIATKDFFNEILRENGVTMNFVLMVTKICSNVPKFVIDDPSMLNALAMSYVFSDSESCVICIQAIMAVAKYMNHLDDFRSYLEDENIPEKIKEIIQNYIGIATKPSNLISQIREASNLQSVIENIVMDANARISHCRMWIEMNSRGFGASKIESLLESRLFSNILKKYPEEFARAIAEVYDVPVSLGNIVIERPEFYPIIDLSPSNAALIEELLVCAKEKSELVIFKAIHQIAYLIPFAFSQLKNIRLVEIFEILLEPCDKIAEFVGDKYATANTNQKKEMMNQAEIVAECIYTMHNLLVCPVVMDVFVPYVLAHFSEQTLSTGKLLVVNVFLQYILHVPTAQMALIALMTKAGWNGKVYNYLIAPDKSRYWEFLLHVILNTTVEYMKCLNDMNDKTAAIIDELMNTPNPFVACFGGYNFIQHLNDEPLAFLSKSVDKEIMNVMTMCNIMPPGHHDYQRVNTSQIQKSIQAAIEALPKEQFIYQLPPGVPPEAFAHLPQSMKSNFLYHAIPTNPRKITSKMRRFLVTKPTWVSHFIRSKPGMMLMPEHYMYIYPILIELSTMEDDVDDILASTLTLSEMCQGDLIETLITRVISSKSSKSKNVIILLAQFARSVIGMDAILAYVMDHLRSHNIDQFDAIIRIIESVQGLTMFPEMFQCYMDQLISACTLSKLHVMSISKIVKICSNVTRALGKEIPHSIAQLIIYVMLVSPETSQDVIAILHGSSQEVKLTIEPYARSSFQKLLERVYEEKANVHQIICTIISYLSNFESLKLEFRPNLIELLDKVLTNFSDSFLELIGVLFDILKPETSVDVVSDSVRDSSVPVSVMNDVDASVGLSIPQHIIDQSPDFWQTVIKHKELINRLIENDAGLVYTHMKFLLLYPGLLGLNQRIRIFSAEQGSKITGRSVNVSVRRTHILEDSYAAISSTLKQPRGAKRPVACRYHVTFNGERGVDAGGVSRDWFDNLVKAMFCEDYALFELNLQNKRSYQPNPLSHVNAEANSYLEFAGAIIARAIIEGIGVDAHLTRGLRKHLLGMPLSLRDLEDVDASLHQSLLWILENDIEEACLELQFAVESEHMGVHRVDPLIENGENVDVTNENKHEYVKRMIEYRLHTQISSQVAAFCRGFHSLIPQEEIRMFNPEELDLVICGVPEIDIEDFKQNVEYYHPYSSEHPVIQMFFRVVTNFTAEEKAKLLLFMTGSSQVPVGGFKSFAEKGHSIKLAPGGESHRLPAAHTCWNQLDLPAYATEEELKTKLLFAIQECNSFGFA